MKNESQIEKNFIKKLKDLKYTYREDIKDINALEENFRENFQSLHNWIGYTKLYNKMWEMI